MEHFDLQYGSIDFLEIENGELTFLELNPTGAFGWIDQAYEGQIYDSIVDCLSDRLRKSD